MAPSFLSTLLDVYCQSFWRHLSAWEIPVVVVVAVAFVTNYVCRVAKKPVVVCNAKHPLASLLNSGLPVLRDKYWPTFWCYQAHFTTIFRSLLKGNPYVPYEGEVLETPDGGEIKLDWVHNEESTNADSESRSRPLILFLPGISGASDENYILHLVRQSMELGYRSVVFNYRGLGGTTLKTPRIYNSTNTEDLDQVVRHIQSRFPDAPIFAVGCSLGGMLLFNYISVGCRPLTVGVDTASSKSNVDVSVFTSATSKLGPEKSSSSAQECPFVAAMTISCVWDPFEAAASLEEPINWALFNRTLNANLCRTVQRNREVLSQKYDVDHVLTSKTIRDFDERLTHKMFGYTSNDAYYKAAVLRDRLHQIKGCPMVCLNALDDPFCPETSVPVDGAAKCDNVALVLTDFGGHIGFIEGVSPYGPNFSDRLFRQLAQNVFAR